MPFDERESHSTLSPGLGPTAIHTAPQPTPYLRHPHCSVPLVRSTCCVWSKNRKGPTALYYKVDFCSSWVHVGAWEWSLSSSAWEQTSHKLWALYASPSSQLQKKGRNLPFELCAVLARGVSSIPTHWAHFADSSILHSSALWRLVFCLPDFLPIAAFFPMRVNQVSEFASWPPEAVFQVARCPTRRLISELCILSSFSPKK